MSVGLILQHTLLEGNRMNNKLPKRSGVLHMFY